MKKTFLFLISISLLSCGIKKELATLKTQHSKLEQEYSQLNNKYKEAKEINVKSKQTEVLLTNCDSKVSVLNENLSKLKKENTELKDNYPVMKFKKPHFDFGQIKMKSENEHVFRFTNTGNSPLVITGVDVDCSCTVPKYPDYAIMPGEEGKITLEYIPSIPTGVQRKKIGILCNTLKGRVDLTTIAEVLDADKKKK